MSLKKRVIIGLIIGLLVAVIGTWITRAEGTEQQPRLCPAGSYDIGITKDGDPICKLEPTGCPYGDSIPMDMCDKFKPVEPVQESPEVLSETVMQEGGK